MPYVDIIKCTDDELEMEIATRAHTAAMEERKWLVPNSKAGWLGAGAATILAVPTHGLSLVAAAGIKAIRTTRRRNDISHELTLKAAAIAQKNKRIAQRKWRIPTDISNLAVSGGDAIFFGVLGPSRLGKSHCLTNLFDLDTNTFNPGSNNSNRTTALGSIKLDSWHGQNLFLIDFPGSDETDPKVATLSSYATDLLHAYVFILDYVKVHTEPYQDMLRDLAGNFCKNEMPPCLILLNKFDTAVSEAWMNNPRLATSDIQTRKQLVIDVLEKTHASAVVQMRATTSAKQGQRKRISEIVKVAYLDDFRASAGVQKMMSDCVEKGLVWDLEVLRKWQRDICQ